VRFVARMMLRSQYRQIEVEGAEHVPAEGPLLIVANHFSSLVDSMALLHASPRPASFLAKAPLWKSGLLRPFLNAVGAVPVYRPEDVAENEGRGTRANLQTFEACRERLQAGGSIALFPEGVSQPQPRLMPVRTGAARIALDVQAPVAILPAGLVYEPAPRDRRGELLVRFGPPFTVNGWDGFPSRRAAITETTRRIEAELRDLLAEAESQSELVALRTLRVVWDQERGIPPAHTLAEEHKRNRRFARTLARLREIAPRDLAAMRADTDAYARSLELAGLTPESLEGEYTTGRVLKFVFTKGPLVLLGTPLAWLAAVVTWPVRKLGDVWALRLMGGSEDMRAICRMLGSGLLLVMLSVAGAIAASLVWNPWIGLAVLVGVSALLAFHVIWRDHREEVNRRVRCFLLLAGGNLRKTLQQHRRALYQRILALADRLEEAEAAAQEARRRKTHGSPFAH
jgi:1-acyl-sn-glycerol-3-phosphate acyltransferase